MWTCEVFGDKFSEKELTLDQFVQLEELLSTKDNPVNWHQIHPVRSAAHAKHVAAVLYSARSGMPFDEAFVKVGQLGAVEFIEHLDINADIDGEPPDPPEGES